MIYQRTIAAAITAHIPLPEATVVIGARQTGKTTILKSLRKTLEDRNEPAHYFTLENPEYLALLNENPLNIFRLVPPSSRRAIVFLDEIQYLKNPSGFIKLLYDEHREKIKCVVSGSSAFFIDRKFTDSLAGRKRIFTLLPLKLQGISGFQKQRAALPPIKTRALSEKQTISPQFLSRKRRRSSLLSGNTPVSAGIRAWRCVIPQRKKRANSRNW